MTDVQLSFRAPVEPPGEMADADLLTALRWTNRAHKPIRKSASAGDVAKFTQALGRRRGLVRGGASGKSVTQSLRDRPALWLVSAFDESARTAALESLWRSFGNSIKRPKGKKAAESYRRATQNGRANRNGRSKPGWFEREAELTDWLSGLSPEAPLRPIELLLLAEILVAAGRELSPPLRWSLWRTVLTNGLSLAANLDEPPGSAATDDQRLIIAGLLPVALGSLFAGISGAGKLRKRGADFLAESLRGATDTDGTPDAEMMERLPLFVATLAAAQEWAAVSRVRLWKPDVNERFQSFIKSALGLFRGDGRLALSNGSNIAAVDVLRSAASAAGFRSKSLPMRLLADVHRATGSKSRLRGPKVPKTKGKSKRKPAVKQSAYGHPVAQSDWAQLACLRSTWSADADLLVVAHDGALPVLDLSAAGVPLIDGAWEIELRLDDRPVELLGEWESVCWHSDRDVDYLELQAKTDSGLIVDRQIALARKDNYACLVDSIHGGDGVIEYSSRLPLADDVTTKTDTDTREVALRKSNLKARCYPLSLPCDRVDGARGEFTAEAEAGLSLRLSSAGGLVAPVVIDWSKKRRKKPADWRRLTVAESGQQVGPEAAGGYSLRVGDLHLVVYRGLRPTVEGRSLLGLHTRHETVIGNFTPKGTVDPVLLVR